MGWFDANAHGHEGYLVGLVRETGPTGWSRWRELSGLVSDEEAQRRYGGAEVDAVQVACECGWRSMRLATPFGVTWHPHVVCLPRDEEDAFEEFGRELWRAHVRDVVGVTLYDCAPGPVAATTRLASGRYAIRGRL